MKTIFTLLTSVFMSAAVFAADARPRSAVTIKAVDNADIRVELDGKRYDANDNTLMIEGLAEGNHLIRVYKQRNSGFFSLNNKRYDLAYSSTITLKKRTHLFITIERSGFVTMQENKIKRTDDRGYGNSQSGQWGEYNTHEGYASGMNAAEFNRVLQSISKEWFEGNKIKSATQVVKTNRLTTAQVTELVRLFTFENNKLELAKQAYENTVDKRNYDQVADLFTYNSSKIELDRYIRNFR